MNTSRKKHLRQGLRNMLECMAVIIGLFLVSINDFNLRAVPLLACMVIIEIGILKILKEF